MGGVTSGRGAPRAADLQSASTSFQGTSGGGFGCSTTHAGAETKDAAKVIAKSIANSPLVKTALAGEDPNWGRIVMAVGKAGEKADRDRLGIRIGGVWVAREGRRVPDYDEAPVAAHMKGQEIRIAVVIGVGRGKAVVWTCDLTHGYIDINGSYRS